MTTCDELRWQAVAGRDAAADGRFVFAVRTTGIYCRPSCPARRALRENVVFFADPATARAGGFRACLRCDPDRQGADPADLERVERICRRLDEEQPTPTLQQLADDEHLSPDRTRELFRELVGVTPTAYASTRRVERATAALQRGATVTAATYEAGYSSSSRFHAEVPPRLGMLPKVARHGGPGEQVTFAVLPSSLGAALVATTPRGLCAVLLGDDGDALVDDLRERFRAATCVVGDDAFRAGMREVVEVVDGRLPAADLGVPLDIRGTSFQHLVWRELREIAAGETIDYVELARRIGRPTATRAVARACAQNPIAVVVPCHRVIRRDGSLAGYRWGLERKRALLQRERHAD